MSVIRVHFTRRKWNPVSWLIRHTLPRSIFCAALSSHAIIDIGDGSAIEASMLHGVRRVPILEALRGSTVAVDRDYVVPDLTAGLAWLETQVGTRYDFKGAFGLVDPDRDWQDDKAWYCYELVAAFLANAGLDIFARGGSITERELLGIKPELLSTIGVMMSRVKEATQ